MATAIESSAEELAAVARSFLGPAGEEAEMQGILHGRGRGPSPDPAVAQVYATLALVVAVRDLARTLDPQRIRVPGV